MWGNLSLLAVKEFYNEIRFKWSFQLKKTFFFMYNAFIKVTAYDEAKILTLYNIFG